MVATMLEAAVRPRRQGRQIRTLGSDALENHIAVTGVTDQGIISAELL